MFDTFFVKVHMLVSVRKLRDTPTGRSFLQIDGCTKKLSLRDAVGSKCRGVSVAI